MYELWNPHLRKKHSPLTHRSSGLLRSRLAQTLEGMRSIVIDCGAVQSEADFWSAYVRIAEPKGAGYFGRNLDAFWDGLNGGPGWPSECELRFINTSSLRALRNGAFIEALHDIASRSTEVKVTVE
jgi:ribonuclease inhibitor